MSRSEDISVARIMTPRILLCTATAISAFVKCLFMVFWVLSSLIVAETFLGFSRNTGVIAWASPEIKISWEKNDNRPDRGCGSLDGEYAKDPKAATDKDANVNGEDGIDRYIGRLVVKEDDNVLMYVEEWCIDNSFYAVRVKREGKPDRSWMT